MKTAIVTIIFGYFLCDLQLVAAGPTADSVLQKLIQVLPKKGAPLITKLNQEKFFTVFAELASDPSHDALLLEAVRKLNEAGSNEIGFADKLAETLAERKDNPVILKILKRLFIFEISARRRMGNLDLPPYDPEPAEKIFRLIKSSKANQGVAIWDMAKSAEGISNRLCRIPLERLSLKK